MCIRDRAETAGISTELVRSVLHEHLCMTKLCARWVPCLPTLYQKQCRKDVSIDCFAFYMCKNPIFLRRFITDDEIWDHHNFHETKQQSKQWTMKSKQTPNKAKPIPSAGKVVVNVFEDACG